MKKTQRVLSFILASALTLSSGAFDGLQGMVKIASAADESANITLKNAKVYDVEYSSTDKQFVINSEIADSALEESIEGKEIKNTHNNPILYMDVNTMVEFEVDFERLDGSTATGADWGMYIVDASNNGILEDSTGGSGELYQGETGAYLSESLKLQYGIEQEDGKDIIYIAAGTLLTGKTYYLRIFDKSGTTAFNTKIKVYNPVTEYNIDGDGEIVGTKSKNYSAKISGSRIGTKTTTDAFAWSISDTNYGSINDNGTFTAKDVQGSVKIIAKSTTGIVKEDENDEDDFIALTAREVQQEKSVVITKSNPATSIVFGAEEYNVEVGSTIDLLNRFTVTPAKATDVYTWTSSDTSVATVNENGVITGKKSGTTTITVRGDAADVYDTCTVQVYIKAQYLNVYQKDSTVPITVQNLRNKGSIILSVKETSDNTSNVPTEPLVVSCADESLLEVIPVNEDEITNVKNFQVNVLKDVSSVTECKVTFSTNRTSGSTGTQVTNVEQQITVRVYPSIADTSSIELYHDTTKIDTDQIDLYIGDSTAYSLSAVISGISTSEPNDQFNWAFNTNAGYVEMTNDTSDSSKVALTGKSKGVTELVATAKSNSNVQKSLTVNVLQAATKVVIPKSAVSVSVGDKYVLTANQTPENSDESIIWSSDTVSVATVDADGVVTGVSVGTATITAKTAHSGRTATCKVTVLKSGAMTLSLTSITKKTGSSTESITATVKDENNNTISNAAVTWESDNEDVVTITSSSTNPTIGTMAFHKVGSANIIAKYGDSVAICVVTVTAPLTDTKINGLYETTTAANENPFTYLPNGMKPGFAVVATYDNDSRSSSTYTLKKEVDYTVEDTCSGVANANTSTNTYQYKMTGTGFYTSGKILYYKIAPKSIEEFEPQIADLIYNGKAQTPQVTLVYDNGVASEVLEQGVDFTVTCTNNVNVGTATATITGKGNFTGTITADFNILQYSINDVTTSEITNLTYNGAAQIPNPVLMRDGTKLIKDTDYIVEYKNNINAGTDTASIIITGKGNYTGEKNITFSILPVDISKANTSVPNQNYTGIALTPDVAATYSNMTLVKGVDYELSYKNNLQVATTSAELPPTVVVKGIGNYTGEVEKKFIINKGSLADGTVVVAPIADQYYAATGMAPEMTVTNGYIYLREGIDYTTTYVNNVNVGTATVTLTGTGAFQGKLETTFNIVQKTQFNTPATEVTVTAKPGYALVGDTIYVDCGVEEPAYFDIVASSSNGKCDDIIYISCDVSEAMYTATTLNVTDGTTATLAVLGKKPGTTKLYVNTMSGTLMKTYNVVVYSPAKTVTIQAQDESGKTYDISESLLNVIENHTVQLMAKYNPTDSTDNVQWSSNNTSIATVNEDGLLTALKPGTVMVTATTIPTETGSRGVSSSCMITVTENTPATSITLDQSAISLSAGKSTTLYATILPDNNTEQIVWASSDEAVATVTSAGKVTAVADGVATITCKNFQGTIVAECQVVVSTPVTAIQLDKNESTINVGESFTLTASLTPTTSKDIVKWECSDNSIVSMVETNPGAAGSTHSVVVTALKGGSCTISVTTSDGKCVAKCTVTVPVKATKPGRVKIQKYKNLKKRTMYVKWKKVKDANGYQVVYSTKKNFKVYKKKAVKTLSVNIKKLKKKKVYYVKVRAFKVVNGEKVYGKWSTVKRVKIIR